jgi:hypothetical protein
MKNLTAVGARQKNWLPVILLIYICQHAIFIIVRIPLFICWSILTCCCDKGQEFSSEEKFEDRIISFDYIEYELPNRGNFTNHVMGPSELAYNRGLSLVVQNA